MESTVVVVVSDEQVPTLTEADRCDGCGARAYVEALFETGTLLLCGHHATEGWARLEDQAIRIIDERWAI